MESTSNQQSFFLALSENNHLNSTRKVKTPTILHIITSRAVMASLGNICRYGEEYLYELYCQMRSRTTKHSGTFSQMEQCIGCQQYLFSPVFASKQYSKLLPPWSPQYSLKQIPCSRACFTPKSDIGMQKKYYSDYGIADHGSKATRILYDSQAWYLHLI